MSAGKLTQKAAEEIYQKSQISRTSFIAELTGSGVVSAADLAHTVSAVLELHYWIWKPLTLCDYRKIYWMPRFAKPTKS